MLLNLKCDRFTKDNLTMNILTVGTVGQYILFNLILYLLAITFCIIKLILIYVEKSQLYTDHSPYSYQYDF